MKNGDISLFNQNLPKDLEKLDPNALTMESRKVKLNTTTITDTGLQLDSQLDKNTGATGNFLGYGGAVSGLSLLIMLVLDLLLPLLIMFTLVLCLLLSQEVV